LDGFNGNAGADRAARRSLAEAHDHLEERVTQRTEELEAQIVERQRAQDKLQASETRLNVVLNSLQIGVMTI